MYSYLICQYSDIVPLNTIIDLVMRVSDMMEFMPVNIEMLKNMHLLFDPLRNSPLPENC